jgi:hypothetical protein
MIRSMKLLAVLTLATAVAAPAFAQPPHARRDATATAVAAAIAYAAATAGQQHQWSHHWGNNNLNPDFQLGGDR